VTAFDAAKHSGLPLLGDARAVLERLVRALDGHRAPAEWQERARGESAGWASEVARLVSPADDGRRADQLPAQAQVIGAINDAAGERGVVVCAAGSAPGDLHKLWRARDPDGKGYHVEYGYSCMGYEIPGGIGVKLAAPEREVFVFIGDGSYLMLPGELVTAVALRVPIVVVLVDNHGYASIGALSRSLGSRGFGTHYRFGANGALPLDPDPGEPFPIDLAANAESLGARVVRARTIADLSAALADARDADGPVVISIEVDRYAGVPGYEGWWDVPVAEVSEQDDVRAARDSYETARRAQRQYLEAVDE
jgi:3D-(3,5/4)-trihydroxycyclohexane-1,2-dione acylhydrolase (decyclizing)